MKHLYILPIDPMSMICLHCGENETPEGEPLFRICDSCFDYAGDYLETNIHLIRAIPELIDLAKTFRAACEERIGVLKDERLEDHAWLEDIDDQIGHWSVLKEQCSDVLKKVAPAQSA